MKTSWVKGLNEQEKGEIKTIFLSNARFRERAKFLLQEKIDTSRQKNTSEAAYDNPNWALKQADAVGYERAMQEIISLFS